MSAELRPLVRALTLTTSGSSVSMVRGEPWQIGEVARVLLDFEPNLRVAPRPSDLSGVPPRSLVLVGLDEAGARWLNERRNAIGHQELRVVLFAPPNFPLRALAPDLDSWTRVWIDLARTAPPWRAARMHEHRRLRWLDGDLTTALDEAFPDSPRHTVESPDLIRASIRTLFMPGSVVVVEDVADEREIWRLHWVLALAPTPAAVILTRTAIPVPGFVDMRGAPMLLADACATATNIDALQVALQGVDPNDVGRSIEPPASPLRDDARRLQVALGQPAEVTAQESEEIGEHWLREDEPEALLHWYAARESAGVALTPVDRRIQADAQTLCGRVDEAAPALMALAQRTTDPDEKYRVDAALARAWFAQGRWPEARRLQEKLYKDHRPSLKAWRDEVGFDLMMSLWEFGHSVRIPKIAATLSDLLPFLAAIPAEPGEAAAVLEKTRPHWYHRRARYFAAKLARLAAVARIDVEATLVQLLILHTRRKGSLDRSNAPAIHALAIQLAEKERHEGVLRTCEDGLNTIAFNSAHPWRLALDILRRSALFRLDRYQEAFDGGDDLLAALGGSEAAPDGAAALTFMLAQASVLLRRSDSEARLRQAIDANRKRYGDGAESTILLRFLLGKHLSESGDPVQGRALLKRAADDARHFALPPAIRYMIERDYGAALWSHGARGESLRLIENGFNEALAKLGPDHEQTTLAAKDLQDIAKISDFRLPPAAEEVLQRAFLRADAPRGETKVPIHPLKTRGST